MSYFYWDDSHKNKEGMNLQECMKNYGTKVVTFKDGRNVGKYKVIFLSQKKDLGYSWMLWFKNARGRNVPVTLYEEKDECIRMGTI